MARSCPWTVPVVWLVLMTTGCLQLVPTGSALRLAPFIDPACTVDCSWPYYNEFNRTEMQFCEMNVGRQDGLTEECSNQFAPPIDPDDRPSEVTNVQVQDYSKNFSSSDGGMEQYTCIHITYTLDYRFVKGLQLTLRGINEVDMNRYYCVNLNFSQNGLRSSALPDKGKSSFSCFCGLRPDGRYQVAVRTMPVLIRGIKKYDTRVIANHGTHSCTDQNKMDVHCKLSPAASWMPKCMSIKQHRGNYDLQVSFELAPSSFCFHVYDVHIYKLEVGLNPSNVASKEVYPKTTASVNGTCTGASTTNVSFVTASFDSSDRSRFPKSAQYYAIIQPHSSCNKCNKFTGDDSDCKRSPSQAVYLIDDPCKKNPCTSNGLCRSDLDKYSCDCLPGYMLWNGTCKVDPCFNESVCGQYGTCNISLINGTILGHNCTCDPRYSIQDEDICELAHTTWYTFAIVGISCVGGVLLFIAVFCLLKKINPFKRKSPSPVNYVPEPVEALDPRDSKPNAHPSSESHLVDMRRSAQTANHQPSISDVAPRNVTEPVFVTKHVLPIFSEDHPRHKDVIVNLCRFLQTECQCQVSLLDWCLPVGPSVEMWLTNAIDNADIVLLLCSKGTGQKYTARANQKRVPNNPTNEYGDVFVKALTLLDDYFSRDDATHKFVVAYFDYSSEEDIPITFRRFPKYCLMQCMETLYLRIHDRVRDSPMSSRRVPALASYRKLELGSTLHNAILGMKELISADSLWYENYNRRHSSGTSGYFSDLQDSLPCDHPKPPKDFFDKTSICSDNSEDFNSRLLQFQSMPCGSSTEDTSAIPMLPIHQVPHGGQDTPESKLLSSDVHQLSDSGFC